MRNLFSVLIVFAIGCGDDDPEVGNSDVDATVETATETVATDTAADSAPGDTEEDAVDSTTNDTADAVDTAIDTTGDAVETDVAETVDTTETDSAADTETVASTCTSADDCALCAFGSKVESAADCYCVFCPTVPMLAAECAANTASWNQFCNPWPGPGICPAASCIPTPAPLCDAGQCVADPNGCFGSEECGACNFTRPPEKPEDCHCPGCPQPLAIDYCDQIQQAVSEVCADFDYDACPRPPCAVPPPIECGQSWTCGYGERLPEDR